MSAVSRIAALMVTILTGTLETETASDGSAPVADAPQPVRSARATPVSRLRSGDTIGDVSVSTATRNASRQSSAGDLYPAARAAAAVARAAGEALLWILRATVPGATGSALEPDALHTPLRRLVVLITARRGDREIRRLAWAIVEARCPPHKLIRSALGA
jgi:hypothetical protein